MAYQSLNIIGSFTAGVPAVQREYGSDRARIEAFRSTLRDQATQQGRMATEDATTVADGEQKVVGDAPHQRRNPYLFLRYPPSEPKAVADDVPAEVENAQRLDVVV